jgi:hypothetical protein
MNYRKKYGIQKRTATYRGIEWQFTYETWLEWWGEDIVKRGCKKDCLVMARIGDIGPYSPTNCKKITHGQNVAEAHLGKKKSPEVVLKISIKLMGNKNGLGNRGNTTKGPKKRKELQ